MDPRAEMYPDMSPYNYVGNNPISNIDMRGDSITPIGNGDAPWDIDRSRGRQAGEFTLYPAKFNNSNGETIPVSVASIDHGNSFYEDKWIIHTGQGYSNFRKNNMLFTMLDNIPGRGAGYWSLWNAESVMGAMTVGGSYFSSTTFRLQGYVNVARREVDALGMAALTPRQAIAATKNPRLYPMFRGNRIDVMTRNLIKGDKSLSHLRLNYSRGPDFTYNDRWWDMTTQNAWKAHVRKYGPGGTHLKTD